MSDPLGLLRPPGTRRQQRSQRHPYRALAEKRLGQFQPSCDDHVEIEGVDQPALVATWLFQLFI